MKPEIQKDIDELFKKLSASRAILGFPRSDFAMMLFALEFCLKNPVFLSEFGMYGRERLAAFLSLANKNIGALDEKSAYT